MKIISISSFCNSFRAMFARLNLSTVKSSFKIVVFEFTGGTMYCHSRINHAISVDEMCVTHISITNS